MPDGRTDVTDAANGGEFPRTNPVRILLGGFVVIAAIGGFLAVRVAVAAAGYPRSFELIAMPAFGVLGLVGFTVLVSGVIGGPDDPDR